MPQITTPQLPDIPSGSSLALAMIVAFAIMALTKKRREGSAAGSPGNLFEALGDMPEDDDPAG